jgi:aryl-phospho-beta-D-glucosidase BglC (GH1 family)
MFVCITRQPEHAFTVDDIAGFLKYWGFNAVRLPVSLPLALNLQGKSHLYYNRNDDVEIADKGRPSTKHRYGPPVL